SATNATRQRRTAADVTAPTPIDAKPSVDPSLVPPVVANQSSDKSNDKPVDKNKDKKPAAEVTADAQTNRTDQSSEEAAIVPYYNNFFTTYRLGPEDVISVTVFGQDRYSKQVIVIPPSGRISLAT